MLQTTLSPLIDCVADIQKIPYLPNAGPGNVMCFKHYHAEEVGVQPKVLKVRTIICSNEAQEVKCKVKAPNYIICQIHLLFVLESLLLQVLMGRKMEDWLRFSVCYWHSFCGTGTASSLSHLDVR